MGGAYFCIRGGIHLKRAGEECNKYNLEVVYFIFSLENKQFLMDMPWKKNLLRFSEILEKPSFDMMIL